MATQQVTQTQYWERPLTWEEIRDRTAHLIEMLADHETVVGKIDEHKRHCRDHDTQKKRLEFQIGTTRREIQRGFIYETRQVKLELDLFDPARDREPVETPRPSPFAPGTLADEHGNPIEDPRPEAKPAVTLPPDDAEEVCPECGGEDADSHLSLCSRASKPAKKKRARKKAARS